MWIVRFAFAAKYTSNAAIRNERASKTVIRFDLAARVTSCFRFAHQYILANLHSE